MAANTAALISAGLVFVGGLLALFLGYTTEGTILAGSGAGALLGVQIPTTV